MKKRAPTVRDRRIAVFLVCVAASVATSSRAAADTSLSPRDEVEFQRTTDCTRAGMPMDFQFVVPGSPPALGASASLQRADLERIARTLDATIGALLANAAREAWSDASAHASTKDAARFRLLLEDMESRFIAEAPARLGRLHCGDENMIGSTIFAMTVEWFGRVTTSADDRSNLQRWFGAMGPNANNGQSFLMLATALTLAKVDYSYEQLLADFRDYARNKK